MLTTIRGVSIDCPDVINFALGIHLDLVQPTTFNLLKMDCCANNTVIRCSNSRVIALNFFRMNLNGSINGTSITSKVSELLLNFNKITGSLPDLPPSITRLRVAVDELSGMLPAFPVNVKWVEYYNNQFNGSIPEIPATLGTLFIDGNKMSGILPMFPASLVTLHLGFPGNPGNKFSGLLKLYQPHDIIANDNLITDIFIHDTKNLTICDLSNNPLLGNPVLSNLTMCIQNGLYFEHSTEIPSYRILNSFRNYALRKTKCCCR